MTDDQREIRRKLRVLEHAELTGDVSRTCRYFGVGRASFYRWRQAYLTHGEAGLASKRSVPHNHPNKTSAAIVEKVLRDCHKFCARGRFGSSDDEPVAEEDGELCFCLDPLARRPFPFFGRLIEHEI